ncbi:MAG: cysteine synthase A [Deltaproteobacteria bacterium]|nr:cysteine synthase A [Deltaproteobacteria bacterium]
MVVSNILDCIGNTPMINLKLFGLPHVYAKAEHMNPGGSIKDRVARYLIEQAEKSGKLKPGMTIVEASSGNTGIGVTMVGVQRGYKVVIIMPENMSEERRKIIRAFGGELIFTSTEGSLREAVDKVKEMQAADSNVWVPEQFENPGNPEIHYLTTATEIWEQLEGKVDAFVAGVGSGGTLSGVGKFLKEKNPSVRIIAVEPKNSAALLGQEPGLHQIQGIGDGFIPPVLDVSLIDDVEVVTDEDAVETARGLARKVGLLVGTSSGANVWAASRVSHKPGGERRVVTVLPDRAERYFSTALI